MQQHIELICEVVNGLLIEYIVGENVTLSAEPVAKMNSLYGLNDRQFTCKKYYER